MAAKVVSFGADARERMLQGVDTLANAVKIIDPVMRAVERVHRDLQAT